MAAGGVITTGSHPKALWPGVHSFWGQKYSEHPPEYPDLFADETSNLAFEQDVQITPFGLAPRKVQGGPVTYDYETQGPVQTYLHIPYALGWIVTYEEMRDNKYEIVARNRTAANAFSIRQTLEVLAAAVYNDAFTGAVYQNANGQPLCSIANPNTTGGTFQNELNPGGALLEATLEDMCILIMGATDDRGNKISLLPRSLIIAWQQWFNANRLLKSVMQPGTDNNDINVLKATNAFPEGIKMNHYLSAPDSWFTRTNAEHGMMMFWRDKPLFDQDNDFATKNALASTYFRVSFGNTEPRGIYGSQGP